ncbi:MAG: hypothetical protein M1829_003992 [Trizodia sp. TS-e1964]|nr:MAG: hypothetical protein M1829_003992 [Trizodia sp. TS-e1964]
MNVQSNFRRATAQHINRRGFHDYFITNLPSSSLHSDPNHHKLPISAFTPHQLGSGSSPAAAPQLPGPSRELTVVRIPLRSAKHHFGVSVSRGTRPYNEDTFQAGVVEVPAFAKKSPVSLTKSSKPSGDGNSAHGASSDPQVFYFGAFDGHGGTECSAFLREHLHEYVEDAARQFNLQSTLKKTRISPKPDANVLNQATSPSRSSSPSALYKDPTTSVIGSQSLLEPNVAQSTNGSQERLQDSPPQHMQQKSPIELEQKLVSQWKGVGGYFRRFKPLYFSVEGGGRGYSKARNTSDSKQATPKSKLIDEGIAGIETIMMYAFLKADLDFVTAQASRMDEDVVRSEKALNDGDIFGEPSKSSGHTAGPRRFKGGSTCSLAMISTPTPTPFWHPTAPSTLLVSHVGDTRIILCATATGLALPLTTNHHPSSPGEGNRLRRFAATFVTDSFGEERMSGLANTRAFGDMQSKPVGVSAEPDVKRIELGPAEYSFMVLVSDGISGTLGDQEIVDIVKEAKTPDQGAKDVVSFTTEVSRDGDNATCLVVRLGGWERRAEGGVGSMGTREERDWKRQEASDPRNRRT